MIEMLIPAIPPLVGVIIGAVLTVLIPNHLREKSENKKFKRAKLEELYEDITKWVNTFFFKHIMNFYLVFSKVFDWNKYLEEINTTADPHKEYKFFKSEIIINMYFQELLPELNSLTEAIQSVHQFINKDIKQAYLASIDIQIFKSEFDVKVKNVSVLAENLKDKIKEISKKI